MASLVIHPNYLSAQGAQPLSIDFFGTGLAGVGGISGAIHFDLRREHLSRMADELCGLLEQSVSTPTARPGDRKAMESRAVECYTRLFSQREDARPLRTYLESADDIDIVIRQDVSEDFFPWHLLTHKESVPAIGACHNVCYVPRSMERKIDYDCGAIKMRSVNTVWDDSGRESQWSAKEARFVDAVVRKVDVSSVSEAIPSNMPEDDFRKALEGALMSPSAVAHWIGHHDAKAQRSYLRTGSGATVDLDQLLTTLTGNVGARIVFLNACMSAKRQASHLLGPPAEFWRLGASSIIGSLSNVNGKRAYQYARRLYMHSIRRASPISGHREATSSLLEREGDPIGLAYVVCGMHDIELSGDRIEEHAEMAVPVQPSDDLAESVDIGVKDRTEAKTMPL